MLQDRIESNRQRLVIGAFINEAAVSHGIVMPVLAALGWDVHDPAVLMPEYTSGRGRVDFALLTAGP